MEKERKNTRRNKGITLIALVITVIILLILAGISIAELTGTGIFAKAKEAKQKYKEAEDLENQTLAEYERLMNELGGSSPSESGGGDDGDEPNESDPSTQISDSIKNAKESYAEDNTKVTDSYENTLVVPKGFKIAEDSGSNVTEGIVIKDKNDNEFVWIPVGEVKGKQETDKKTIELNRYKFGTDGTPEKQDDKEIEFVYQELSSSSSGNSTAKDLEGFKKSATTNHGYYIGRYEARKDSSGSKVTEKSTDTVWNGITQPNASTNCQAMYTSDSFTSDLMNSYAWDTAIVFLQEFDNRTTDKTKKYSRQNRLNTTLENKGTNNSTDENKKDKICNIYDMASNVKEWTTETCGFTSSPCTARGGNYNNSDNYTSSRHNSGGGPSYSDGNYGFRPLLYCSTES